MDTDSNKVTWVVIVVAVVAIMGGLFVKFVPNIDSQMQAYAQTVIGNFRGSNSVKSSDSDDDDNSPFIYQYDTDAKTAEITGYKPKSGDYLPANLEIPAYKEHNGVKYTVTSIGKWAFTSTRAPAQGVSVTLPDTIKTIGAVAFYNTKLTSVDFPDSLTSIGDSAFEGTKLTSVDLPAGLTSIGDNAFRNTKLTSVHLPDSLTSIGNYAFRNTKLTSVHLPDSLTSIGNYAFCGTKLTRVDFPAGLTSIGNGAFESTALTSVDFPASVTSIGDYAFYNTPISAISFKTRVDLGDSSFTQTNLKNVTLPTGSTYHTDGNNSTFDNNVKVTFN